MTGPSTDVRFGSPAAIEERLMGPLRHLALAFLLVTLAMALAVPVYTDEIGWTILQARLFRDGGVNISLFAHCGEAASVAPPWFLFPARAFDAILLGTLGSPLRLRVTGLVCCLLWLALASLLARTDVQDDRRRRLATGLLVAFAGLGVLPFMLVLHRPEQTVLVLVTALLLVVLRRRNGSLAGDLATSAAILVVGTWLFASHPKALLFFPLVAVGLFAGVRRRGLAVAALAAAAGAAAGSYGWWAVRTGCPDDPAFARSLQGQQLLTPGLLLSNPAGTVRLMLASLARVDVYLRSVLFQADYWNDWLPATGRLPFVGKSIRYLLILTFLLGLAAIGLLLWRTLARARGDVESRRRAALALACLLFLVALGAVQVFKNWYESALVVPLLITVLLVLLPAADGPRERRLASAGTALALALSLVSQAWLWSSYLPFLKSLPSRGGYLPAQPTSVSSFRFAETRDAAVALARRCGLDPGGANPRLVVDDLTYLAFSAAYRPMILHYLVEVGGEGVWTSQRSPEEIEALVARAGSSGVIVGCRELPPAMLGSMRTDGTYCCRAAPPGAAR